MAEKPTRSAIDTQDIDAAIAELKQKIGRDADKVAGIRRHRRIRASIAAVVGSLLCGPPTFIVQSKAGVFATLVGACIGFFVIQIYFLVVPGQFAISSIVRQHKRAEEDLAQLFNKRRWRIEG